VARAPLFFSVAKHIVPDYASNRKTKRAFIAPPAFTAPTLNEASKRDPHLVLAVGDFYPQKNYPLLIEAFAKLRDVHSKARLVIIGRPVQEAVRDELLAVARMHNVLEALTLIPGVTHDHLMRMMAQAAVYVSTSSAEAFNMPVLEAMACGTPVVVLETPFQREVAGEDAYAGAIFVEQGGDTAAGLAIAMLGLLTNPQIATTIATRGLKRAHQFTWEKTSATLLEGMAKLCKV
jgi:glycosyltransferase involved in cell wall biosynthesis